MDGSRSDSVYAVLQRATQRLSFQDKIRMLPKVAAAALLLILVVTVTLGAVSGRSAVRIREGYYPSVQLSREIRENLALIQRRLQDGVSAKEIGPLEEADSVRNTLLRELDGARGNPVLDGRALDLLGRDIGAYYALARSTSARMIAGELGDSVFKSLQLMTSRYKALSEQLEQNIARDQAKIDDAFSRASVIQLTNTSVVAVVAVLCVIFLWLLSAFTARLLTSSLTDPLRHAVRVADRLAVGDMTVSIPSSAEGEVGDLLRSMEQMVRYLNEMATAAESITGGDLSMRINPRSDVDTFGNAFRSMTLYLNEMASVAESVSAGDMTRHVEPRSSSDSFGRAFQTMTRSISEIMRTMRESAEAIAGAAAQVAASAHELSESTTEEAAIVLTAAGGVERVNGLVARNAADSREMETMAVQGARDAEESGAAMRETVRAMQTIAAKTSVVNDIATETKLLALNAAIEAARAGESGRGFGVVATEVGKLAAGSRAAAHEISVVVQTSHKVAGHSGELLDKLMPAIAKTTALVQRVAAASEEQSKGLQLVNQAMGDVDQATQRNAAAAQELAATASEMASQAESLQLALSRFRVNPGELAPEPAGGGKSNGSGGHVRVPTTKVLVGKHG